MKRFFLICLVTLFIGFGLVSPAFATILGFEPASQTLALGDSFDLEVTISELGPENVSAFDLFVGYDSSILNATSVAFGPYLGDLDPFFFETETGSDLSSPGVANFSELSYLFDFELEAFQPDSFTLATITFETLALGTSALSFLPHPFFNFQDVKGLNFQVLPLDIESATVAVVPEPGTMLLLVTGLGGLGSCSILTRRRRSKKE